MQYQNPQKVTASSKHGILIAVTETACKFGDLEPCCGVVFVWDRTTSCPNFSKTCETTSGMPPIILIHPRWKSVNWNRGSPFAYLGNRISLRNTRKFPSAIFRQLSGPAKYKERVQEYARISPKYCECVWLPYTLSDFPIQCRHIPSLRHYLIDVTIYAPSIFLEFAHTGRVWYARTPKPSLTIDWQ